MAKVVVIGAGLSGLSAARRLMDKGVDVVVLEARNWIGGRMCRKEVKSKGGKAAILDLGGQWVGPGQDAILKLARDDLGLTTFDQHVTGLTVVAYGNNVYRSDTDPPGRTEADAKEAEALSEKLGAAAEGILPEPWKSPGAEEHDKRTLSQWIEAEGANSAYAKFYVGLDARFNQSGGSPDKVSLLHALFERKVNPPAGEPDKWLIEGGAGQIPDAMTQKYNIKYQTDKRVTAISQTRGKVSVTVEDGTVEPGDAAIVAMPPSVAAAIDFSDPQPSAQRIDLASKMAMGTIAKVAFVYDEPWWRDIKRGETSIKLSGTSISRIRTVRTTADSGLLKTDTHPDPPGILTCFIQGDQYAEWSKYSPDKREQCAHEDLKEYFQEAGVDAPREYVEMLWPAEPFTGGAYNGYLPPGGWTSCGRAIREPLGKVFWAGTETATKWFGYFDGAITAGYRAAEEAWTAVSAS